MKNFILVLLLLSISGCYSGKDPVADYPELQNFEPEYEPIEPKTIAFEVQYGIDPEMLTFTSDESVIAKPNMSFQLLASIAGKWSEDYRFSLKAIPSDNFESIEIIAVDEVQWKIIGTLNQTNENRNLESVPLQLVLEPSNTHSIAFSRVVESLAIDPISIFFHSSEEN
tara:strand:+ start:141466 stop:141972 length:507 start_codon:yes stop_codon:yes gene_type:complete